MGKQRAYLIDPLAAFSMMSTTAAGCETITAWLAFTSTVVALAFFAITACTAGGIIPSCDAIRYHTGFDFHAGCVTTPPTAARPQPGCESAMNLACFASTSAANAWWNFDLSIVRIHPVAEVDRQGLVDARRP